MRKTNSYLCINRNGGADCDGCFNQLEDAAKKGVKFKSKAAEANHRSTNTQRPRSFHISSCYKDPAHHAHHHPDDDHYLKSQPDWNVKTYAGHGHGHGHGPASDNTLVLSDANPSTYNSFPRRLSERVLYGGVPSGRIADLQPQLEPSLVDPPYYRRSLPKSTGDLLAAQLQNQCQMSHLQQVRRSPKHGVGGVGMVQQQSLDSISFYTRPPQPKSTTDSQLEYSASRPVHYHQSQHQLRLSLKQVQQHQLQQQEYYPQQQQQLVSRPSGKSLRRQKPSSKGPESSIHDEGGFDEVRSFRTLPMVTKRATDYR